MDSTEINKIAAAVIGAFLVLLLLNFATGQIYGTGEGGHHGEEQLAFAVEIETADDAGEEEAVVDLVALLGGADPAAGEKTFKKCKACHKVEEGVNGAGPSLWGVVGRDIASGTGFSYSSALTDLEGDWTLDALSGFLEDPKGYASGTKMVFKGLSDPQDRVDLIVYLNEADGTPETLE